MVEADGVHLVKGRPYSAAIRAGDWLLISGQVPLDADGRTVSLEPAAQFRQCLENIKALVEAAGGTLGDVIALNIFLTDIRHLALGEVRREYFEPPYPATTTVAISGLAHEDWVVEIEARAYLG
jgi:2-iminobutanoate/2-iminopropanoate deaminase